MFPVADIRWTENVSNKNNIKLDLMKIDNTYSKYSRTLKQLIIVFQGS